MSEPFDEGDAGHDGPTTASEVDVEIARDHDPLGLDLAAQIARGTLSSPSGVELPPSRGIRAPRRRQPRPDVQQRSGSGPDARDPQPLGAALTRVIRQRGWQREVNLRLLLDRWPALVGETNAQHSTPEAYRDKVLTIRAESSVWATSLRTIAPSLVAILNKELGDGTVTRVTVLGPSAPSWKHGPKSVRDGRGPRDTYG